MKKILLTFFVTVLSVTAMAQSVADKAAGVYTGKLYVDLTGTVTSNTEAADGDYNVNITKQNDQTITFTLSHFGFMGMNLGDIVLENIPVSTQANHIVFGENAAKKLVFNIEQNGQSAQIIATAKVNAEKSAIEGDSMKVYVDVVWVNEGNEMPIGVYFAGAKPSVPQVAQNYQIPNAGFEEWAGPNEPSTAWHSFQTAKGKWAMFKGSSAANTTQTEGYQGGKAVLLKSRNLFIANANGNVTTGCINMGSTTPADHANYNYTDRAGENHLEFAGLPDSITCVAKFKRGEQGDYNARIRAIIHGDIDYKDPYETEQNEKAYKVADVNLNITPSETWTRFSAPLTYTDVQAPKRYALVNITTNPKAGATANDELTVDDVIFIYNSSLSKVTYNAEDITIPAEGDTVQILAPYNADNFIALTNAHAATVEKTFDTKSKVLTVVVKGNDIAVNPSNFHTYKFYIDSVKLGVSTPTQQEAQKKIYDLQGRRVEQANNGLYIIDGKKVIR